MQRFEDFTYERPNMDEVKQAFQDALETFKNASSADEQEQAMEQINKLRLNFQTMAQLANVRHSIDTNDEFYEKEKAFFNQNSPAYSQLNNAFYRALDNASFKEELINRKGALLFEKARMSLKTFDPAIMDEMKQENELTTKHQKILASAQIEFEGKEYNLSQMAPFAQSKDRETRKKASKAVSNFFQKHEDDFDDIYDKLIELRTTMAKKLGYPSFTELAYDRLGRMGYGPKEVKAYRDQVADKIVPLVDELQKRKGKRIDVDPLYHYDLSFEFKSGNPTPKGDKDALVAHAKTMYEAMGEETGTFFNMMVDRNLMDLESKKGKAGGGYCTMIADYGVPFIFANFNGTKHDVDVLTHEAGHAFQFYMSMPLKTPEYILPSFEAAEIFSMSMEFLAWPWVEGFFKEDTDKYKFSHLSQALFLITYGVSIDEFQHEIYARPELSKQERKDLWRSIEQKYAPYRVYKDDRYLEGGNAWQRIMHIFAVPFYMIDYTLAQAVALQFWTLSQKDYDHAFDRYVKLAKIGGSKPFINLVEEADLSNPFTPGTLDTVIKQVKDHLDSVDDTNL